MTLRAPFHWTAEQRHALGIALAAAAGYYLSARIGVSFTLGPMPISVLWLPNAILLTALLFTPLRHWWLTVLLMLPGHLAANAQGQSPVALQLGWFVSNASEALMGAACVLRLLGRPPRFDSLQDARVFLVCAVLLAPFASSFLDAAMVVALGDGGNTYWGIWQGRLFSNVLAELVVVPLIVTWMQGSAPWREAGAARIGEALLLGAGLLFVGVLAFDAPPEGGVLPGLLYMPMPFLIWAALRFGPRGATGAFVLVVGMVIWGAGHGNGPFVADEPELSTRAVQVALAVLGAGLLLLACGVEESRAMLLRVRKSEARFAACFNSSPEAMLISRAADGQVLDVNDRGLEMLGALHHEVVGRGLRSLGLESAVNESRRPGEVHRLHGDVDGHGRGHEPGREVTVAACEVELEGESCMITSVRDVSELARANEQLRLNDERFQLVLKATRDVIFDWDVARNRLWWNENGREMFGYYPGSWSVDDGQWEERVHPEDRKCVMAQIHAALAGGPKLSEGEYRVRRADGSYADVHVRRFMLRDGEGRALRMIGSIMDISDHRRVEEANKRLAHVSRLAVMGELTASIAHEINQPLGAILSNVDAAEVLLNEARIPVEELRQIIEDIRQDDMRAGEVIKHMRALMRKRDLAMQPFDLNRAIGDVLNLASADLGRHRVSVESHFAPLSPILGDQVHVQQVVLNLLLNGVDAMAAVPHGQRRLQVYTERLEGGGAKVLVKDSGPGISPEHLAQLFESFFTTKPEGMGLGLSIARSIVETHGGIIGAESGNEGGACFFFTLPRTAG